MPLIDDDGDLFGTVNAVDAAVAVVSLILLVTVAVAGSVGSADQSDGVLTQTVTVETGEITPATAESVTVGPVDNESVVAIRSVTRSETNGTYSLSLSVVLPISVDDGLTFYRGSRLYIGRELAVDVGDEIVVGVMTNASEPRLIETERLATPTPTDTTTPTPTDTTTPTDSPTRRETASPTAETVTTATETAMNVTVVVTANVTRETAAAVERGPGDAPGVVSVLEREVNDTSGDRVILTLRVQIDAELIDETVLFRGVELQRGQQVRLQLGGVPVLYEVTEVAVTK